ncbi:hypothetical protein NLI96_g4602 [Meripilus lineatus]|uniref:Uncharacterized protein n=1 Tax=Meripilus lineatus TaxID=2056292 RepID=A0AAD5V4M5_9APHY|nr:hypothetical protein NLI96_g4602 [Physisporinus lineatus]
MADVFLDPARLGKWRGLCRSDPERVLRVFHLYPPHAKSPEGDTGDEVVAMMRALQEIAVGQGVSGKPDPAWKDLVEAGIIEELCNSVQTLVMDVKPKTPMGVPKEISEVVAKEGPSPCFLPFAILNDAAVHFSEPPGPLDKRMLSALRSQWADMMRSVSPTFPANIHKTAQPHPQIWENPQNTLLPDPFHSRYRNRSSCITTNTKRRLPTSLAFNDLTVPVMTRMWIASATSEGDGMDALLTSMVMKNLFSPFDHPSDEQHMTDPEIPNLKHVVPLVYLGANALNGSPRSSQADALVEGFIKYFKWGGPKNDIQLPLAFLFYSWIKRIPILYEPLRRMRRFGGACFL